MSRLQLIRSALVLGAGLACATDTDGALDNLPAPSPDAGAATEQPADEEEEPAEDEPPECTKLSWYPDCDGDGLAALGAVSEESCIEPSAPTTCANLSLAGWTKKTPVDLLSSDCDDGEVNIGLAGTYYADCDGDGFAAGTSGSLTACEPPQVPEVCSDVAAAWTEIEPFGADHAEDNESVDCADDNADVFPGQTAYFTEAIAGSEYPFDYNCDSLSSPRYSGAFTCSLTPYGDGYLCSHNAGFVGGASCGEVATYRSGCTIVQGYSCSYLSEDQRAQECR